jgi:transposase
MVTELTQAAFEVPLATAQSACAGEAQGEKEHNRSDSNKLKHFRAIATRYDKLAKIFLAGVHLACAAILLN